MVIAYLSGVVILVSDASIVLVTAGVGRELGVTERDAQRARPSLVAPEICDDPMAPRFGLWVHERQTENSVDLFGFTQREDLLLFGRILAIHGMSARVSQTLAGHPDLLRSQDEAALRRLPGVGPMKAKAILANIPKLGLETVTLPSRAKVLPVAAATPAVKEVARALGQLGYASAEAEAMAGKALDSMDSRNAVPSDEIVSQAVKKALSQTQPAALASRPTRREALRP